METDNGMNGGLWPYMLPAAASQIIPKVAGQGWHAYFRYSKPTPQQLRCASFLLFGALSLCCEPEACLRCCDVCSGTAAAALVQSLLEDKLSGEKRRLGFVFLYELLRGDIKLSLTGDIRPSIAQVSMGLCACTGLFCRVT